MLHQIKVQQYKTDSGLYQVSTVLRPTKIVEFKDFSRLLSEFPVLFKADLIFKNFSRKLSKFRYFSSLCEPWSRFLDFSYVLAIVWLALFYKLVSSFKFLAVPWVGLQWLWHFMVILTNFMINTDKSYTYIQHCKC